MDPAPYVSDIATMDRDSDIQRDAYGYEALYAVEFVSIEDILTGDEAMDGSEYERLDGTYGEQTGYRGYDPEQWLSGEQDGYGQQSRTYDSIDGYGLLEVPVSYQDGTASDQYKPGYDGQTGFGSGQSEYSSQPQTYDPIDGYGFLELTVSYSGSYTPTYRTAFPV